MAAGSFNIQKASGGVLKLTPADGVTNTNLVLPESGTLLTNSNNVVNIAGTGTRITGDLSNATPGNRLGFQSSTVNGLTAVGIIPNGTSNYSSIEALNSSDTNNHSGIYIAANGTTDTRINSFARGTGAYLPMSFYTSGSERMRIDTNGNVGIGVTPSAWNSASKAVDIGYGSLYATGATDIQLAENAYYNNSANWVYKTNGYASAYYQLSGAHNWRTAPSGTAGNVITWTNAMTLDTSGNLLLTSGTGGLGYGAGAGGTVTQLTSKSTAVTLNKPTGIITMNNAALAAGATISFALNNNVIAAADDVIVTLGAGAYTPYAYNVWCYPVANMLIVNVKNISGGSLSESVVINFAIIKGATS